MKTLFRTSLILPAIYVIGVIWFFAGTPFGLGPTELIHPYEQEVFAGIAVLTFGFVAICLLILWRKEERLKTKVWWAGLLILGNMFTVPYFFWCLKNGNLQNAYDKSKRKPNRSWSAADNNSPR